MNESSRARPIACCSDIIEPSPLAAEDRRRLSAAFKALGDPTRMQIFRLIASQHAPICACDIVDRFAVSQPTVAHHTRILREAGLITATKVGIWAYYQADPHGLDLLSSLTELLVSPSEGIAAIA